MPSPGDIFDNLRDRRRVSKHNAAVDWENKTLAPDRRVVYLTRDALREWVDKGKALRESCEANPAELSNLQDHRKLLPGIEKAESIAAASYVEVLHEKARGMKPSDLRATMLRRAEGRFDENRGGLLKALEQEKEEQDKVLSRQPQSRQNELPREKNTNPFRSASSSQARGNLSGGPLPANGGVAQAVRATSPSRPGPTGTVDRNPFRSASSSQARGNLSGGPLPANGGVAQAVRATSPSRPGPTGTVDRNPFRSATEPPTSSSHSPGPQQTKNVRR
jgi:hypothetical protein